jgi:hypothetical protein
MKKKPRNLFDDDGPSTFTAGAGDADRGVPPAHPRKTKRAKSAKPARKVAPTAVPKSPVVNPPARPPTETKAFAKAEKELDAAAVSVGEKVDRETWLCHAVAAMTPRFLTQNYKVPLLRVSCGWPSVRPLSEKKRSLAECWRAEAATDGIAQIFVSPFLADGREVIAALVHEVVHSVVGHDAKHGKLFKKCALAVGLDGKMTATTAGPELLVAIDGWMKDLGAYPHARLDQLKRPTKKQGTRMIKMECEKCGYVARTTRKWLEEVGAPLCACNKQPMKFELPVEDDKEEGGEDED